MTVIAGLNMFDAFKKKNELLFIFFLAVAILFNPFRSIYLNKNTWTTIDLVLVLFFGVITFIDKNKKDSV